MGIWKFPDTDNKWADPQNKLACTWKDTKIISNRNMILSFMINISATDGQWRNIIHITNTNRDCCSVGDRVPGMWITPNDTSFHIASSTPTNGNEYFDTARLEMGKDTVVTVYWYGRYIKVFFDGVLVNSKTQSNVIIEALPDAYVYIGDSWYGTLNASRNFKLKDLYLKDIYASEDYELLKVGDDSDTACRGAGWNPGGGWPKYIGRLTSEQCATSCSEDPSCAAIDFNTNMDAASGTYDCWLFNNKGNTVGETTSGGALGCYQKIKVETTDCKYKMSNTELDCYNQNYPDLQDTYKGDHTALQNHWASHGCQSSELRNNQCPSIQNVVNNYKYKGCYNENVNSRAVHNFRGKVNTLEECASLAEENKESIFALNNNNNCYTCNSESTALKYGWNAKSRIECNPNGGENTIQVYIRDVLYADKPANSPELQTYNFSNEKFSNIYDEGTITKTEYNMMKISVIIIILILLIIIVYHIV
jgi:hypothetical protein